MSAYEGLTGKHLIAGNWVADETIFKSYPVDITGIDFAEGTANSVDMAAKAAEDGFWFYSETSRSERAQFLNRIADEIEERGAKIPFYGELVSVNSMFLFPEALSARGSEIGAGWAALLSMGTGQFCTNPGVAVVIDGADADAFEAAAVKGLSEVGAQTMVTDGI